MANIATNTFSPNERLGRENINEFFAATINYKDSVKFEEPTEEVFAIDL